jgi:hypothetical protein
VKKYGKNRGSPGKYISNSDIINRCIHLIEKRVANPAFVKRWEQTEIKICLDEIKVSLRNGGHPKYSIRMLLSYCTNFPLLYRLAHKISELVEGKPELSDL